MMIVFSVSVPIVLCIILYKYINSTAMCIKVVDQSRKKMYWDIVIVHTRYILLSLLLVIL